MRLAVPAGAAGAVCDGEAERRTFGRFLGSDTLWCSLHITSCRQSLCGGAQGHNGSVEGIAGGGGAFRSFQTAQPAGQPWRPMGLILSLPKELLFLGSGMASKEEKLRLRYVQYS